MTDDRRKKLDLIERMWAMHKPERIFHLAAVGATMLLLLAAAGLMIFHQKAAPAELALMFGSSGLIGYTAGQLLRMWETAIRIVFGADHREIQ